MLPRLLLFAACEKVIIDTSNNISLITLLQELTVEIPTESVPPGRLPLVPLKWDVVTVWAKDKADPGTKVYDNRFQLFDPSGQPLNIKGQSEIVFGDKLFMRSHGTLLGFPIASEGVYTLRLWLQEKGQPEGEPLAEFPINLIRRQPKA